MKTKVVDAASIDLVCGQIVPLDDQQVISGAPSEPSITNALYSSSPVSVANPSVSITHGLKFVTVADSGSDTDECSITVAFPGNKPQEAEGMFNGMLWKDFIDTNNGE